MSNLITLFVRFNLCYWTDVRWHRENKTNYVNEFKKFTRTERMAMK